MPTVAAGGMSATAIITPTRAVETPVNVLSINLAALVVLWYSGYRPERLFRQDDARAATLKRVAVLVAAIALLSVFLGGITYDSYRTAQTEEQIRGAVVAELEEPQYEAYELVELEVQTEARRVLLRRPRDVTVTVGVPPDADRPGLADPLQQRLRDRNDIAVAVDVLYLEIERGDEAQTRV